MYANISGCDKTIKQKSPCVKKNPEFKCNKDGWLYVSTCRANVFYNVHTKTCLCSNSAVINNPIQIIMMMQHIKCQQNWTFTKNQNINLSLLSILFSLAS